MAARVSSRRRWFLRDLPRTYVLFVWLAFGLAAFIYAIDWHPSCWSTLRQETAAKLPQDVVSSITTARSSSYLRAGIFAGSG